MQRIEWDSRFEPGIEDIDLEHRDFPKHTLEEDRRFAELLGKKRA